MQGSGGVTHLACHSEPEGEESRRSLLRDRQFPIATLLSLLVQDHVLLHRHQEIPHAAQPRLPSQVQSRDLGITGRIAACLSPPSRAGIMFQRCTRPRSLDKLEMTPMGSGGSRTGWLRGGGNDEILRLWAQDDSVVWMASPVMLVGERGPATSLRTTRGRGWFPR